MDESELQVTGMTCAHCEQTVRTELAAVPGVTGVEADATTGRVLVQYNGLVDRTAVEAAVREAGYEVASWTSDPR